MPAKDQKGESLMALLKYTTCSEGEGSQKKMKSWLSVRSKKMGEKKAKLEVTKAKDSAFKYIYEKL